MSGFIIGDGEIIGARALAAEDVPPYTIVGRMPEAEVLIIAQY